MPATLSEKLSRLSKQRQTKIKVRAAELIAEEMSVRDLRKAMAMTQEDMAERLHIRQDGVSRIENRTDLLISTLRNYVAKMGGDLELVVKFPNRPPIILHGVGEIGSRS